MTPEQLELVQTATLLAIAVAMWWPHLTRRVRAAIRRRLHRFSARQAHHMNAPVDEQLSTATHALADEAKRRLWAIADPNDVA